VRIYKIAAKAQWLGNVEATDEAAAIEKGRAEFKVPANRLMANELHCLRPILRAWPSGFTVFRPASSSPPSRASVQTPSGAVLVREIKHDGTGDRPPGRRYSAPLQP
jgi:hypothetical protein